MSNINGMEKTISFIKFQLNSFINFFAYFRVDLLMLGMIFVIFHSLSIDLQ
jgi:hypothetical protein